MRDKVPVWPWGVVAVVLVLAVAAALVWSSARPGPGTSPISPLDGRAGGVVLGATRTPTPAPTAEVPGNLLVNPSFEGQYHNQDGIGEINVPEGWRAWFLDAAPCRPWKPGCDVLCPLHCYPCTKGDPGCYWARPEMVPMGYELTPYRVHSGLVAQKGFTYGRQGEWGVYQQVHVEPGTWLRFSAWLQGWQCYDFGVCCLDYPCFSDAPYAMNFRVGIDPAGGVDPMAGGVVWSGLHESFDAFGEVGVIALAEAPTVTVFVRAAPRFDWARMNNDAYFDDAALVAIGPLSPGAFMPFVLAEGGGTGARAALIGLAGVQVTVAPTSSTISVGEVITLAVAMWPAVEVQAVEVQLTFDADVVEVVRLTGGGLIEPTVSLRVGDGWFGGVLRDLIVYEAEGKLTGESGVLFYVVLRGKAPGRCAVEPANSVAVFAGTVSGGWLNPRASGAVIRVVETLEAQ